MELTKLIWPWQAGRQFLSDSSEPVEIVRPGQWSPGTSRFLGAQIVILNREYYGDVLIGAPDELPGRPILQIAHMSGIPHILKDDDSFVPQIRVPVDPVTALAWQMLREKSGSAGCAKHVKALEDIERISFFTRLQADRLTRKCAELVEIHDANDKNWNETLYIMLARSLGTTINKKAFQQLAERVRYNYILRERSELQHIESMLLGTSGLLDLYNDDSYIRTLKKHYEHLRNKYSLVAMPAGAWKTNENKAGGHPVLRIVQMASLLVKRDRLLDDVLACRTVADIQALFRVEASEYWSKHFTPGNPTHYRPKRIGADTANMLGINLVATMLRAYGDYLNDERMREAAIGLLEKIAHEDNKVTVPWREAGVHMECAFDSQAIIELHNIHCKEGRCSECDIARRVIRKTLG